MPIHRSTNITYYTSEVLDKLGVKHGFFMRHGGVSLEPWSSLNLATSVGDSRKNVIENRTRIANVLDRNSKSFYDVWQVHSNKVIISNSPRKLTVEHKKADAIITQNNDVTLLMLFADCVPILLYDKIGNISAIAHAGWKGTVNKVVGETVTAMCNNLGSKVDNIIACIGPSICATHYMIGKDVVKEVRESFPDTSKILINHQGNYHLDLQQANTRVLLDAGVTDIYVSGICTACNTEDWFSHRAESGKTGRFGAIMTCK